MTDDDEDTHTPIPIEQSDFEPRDESEILDELEDAAEESLPGLEDGLDTETMEELQSLISGTGSKHHATILASDPDDRGVHMSMSTSTPTDKMDFDTFDVEVDHEQANTLLKHVYVKLREHEKQYGYPDELVLGLPQFHILEPWAQAEYGHSIEEELPVSVTVVPGPVIHPVVDNRVLYTEYLREEHDG